jgi:hypothetical protein
MFKKFNHQFVYKYPLIWNTKIIPFALIALVIHFVFFAIGYQNAVVSSVQTHSYYNQESNATTINLFAILISVLVFIIWCFLYFRNNAFKAFYPKSNSSLFKEWLLIVLFGLLNFSYALSSIFGANLQTRNTMPREIALEHCKTISKASVFLQGSYKEGNWIDSMVNGNYQRFERDSFSFEGKKYALKSLMNKNMESFPFFNSYQDSLMRLQVQRWMKENKKAEIATIFQDYFAISNTHQLKSNITPATWMELVYSQPEFTKYTNIGTTERELQFEYENSEVEYAVEAAAGEQDFATDTSSVTLKKVDGQMYYYSKYYVSQQVLVKYYTTIAASWENPLLDWDFIMVVLYLSFGVSLLVFSFKVTAARSWLIALISLGVVQIILGIGTLLINFPMTFPVLNILLFVTLCIYFSIICIQKKGKRWSGIVLNQILWLLPGILPMIYTTVMYLVKKHSGYNNRYNFQTKSKVEEFPKIDWLEENGMLLVFINLAIVVLIMFTFSEIIKKWRGIPEE